MRGLLFYNTIYWRRASDGLKPPRLTSEQRRSLAPPKNLDVIKPRVKPRARLDEIRRQHMIDELSRMRDKMPAAMVSKLPARGSLPEDSEAPMVPATPPVSRRSGAGTRAANPAAVPAGEPPTGAQRTVRPELDLVVHRRRRPTSRQMASAGFSIRSIARLFGKKK
jgi:hypothetical protein